MAKKRKDKRTTRFKKQADKEKAEFFLAEACWLIDSQKYEKAENFLKKAIKSDPDNLEAYFELVRLGSWLKKDKLVIDGMMQLYERNLLENTPAENDAIMVLCQCLISNDKFEKARQIAANTLERIGELNVSDRKKFTKQLTELVWYSDFRLQASSSFAPKTTVKSPGKSSAKSFARQGKKAELQKNSETGKTRFDGPASSTTDTTAAKTKNDPDTAAIRAPRPAPQTSRQVPLSIEIDKDAIAKAFAGAAPASMEEYNLVMDAVSLRFKETFDHLLCLSTLSGITSLVYQEETARKILKTFRGRVLLADEVGMGKTIEACMVIREYMMRRMVKNVLILVPTPLVSQWREELSSKFGVGFLSTDDNEFKATHTEFWNNNHIIASINIAKSKKNVDAVISREWDMVVVDEAHHLKNRNTLNWKLVNSLKKRFLLLLTATPVENNLMELYNLITLLKPGQLKTQSAFKQEFMTRGDPTDPRNRTRLKGLLDQVMIRNTRAVANIQIPPRYAETMRTEPNASETGFYNRISALVADINESSGKGRGSRRMVLKHLLAEAGSSPAAAEKTLLNLAGKNDLMHHQRAEIRAISNMVRSMGDTEKNKMLLRLIRAANDKIIVFVKYRATLDHLAALLDWHKISYSLFHGQMPNAQKDREIGRFKNEHNVLLTTELGGEGRNLQFCNKMVNYDLPWNPMRIEQRIGRIHRIGQQRETMIYNLCAAGTIEDYILEILDRKINMFEMVIGEIDMIVGRMREDRDFSDLIYDIWVQSCSQNDIQEAFEKLGTRLKRCKTGYEKTKVLDEQLFGENYEI